MARAASSTQVWREGQSFLSLISFLACKKKWYLKKLNYIIKT